MDYQKVSLYWESLSSVKYKYIETKKFLQDDVIIWWLDLIYSTFQTELITLQPSHPPSPWPIYPKEVSHWPPGTTEASYWTNSGLKTICHIESNNSWRVLISENNNQYSAIVTWYIICIIQCHVWCHVMYLTTPIKFVLNKENMLCSSVSF